MITDEILCEVKERLVEGFAPERIILFGSQARETADARSDVDILVICSFTGKRRHLMVEMDRALDGVDCAFDILILTPEEYERNRQIPGTIARPAWKEEYCMSVPDEPVLDKVRQWFVHADEDLRLATAQWIAWRIARIVWWPIMRNNARKNT